MQKNILGNCEGGLNFFPRSDVCIYGQQIRLVGLPVWFCSGENYFPAGGPARLKPVHHRNIWQQTGVFRRSGISLISSSFLDGRATGESEKC